MVPASSPVGVPRRSWQRRSSARGSSRGSPSRGRTRGGEELLGGRLLDDRAVGHEEHAVGRLAGEAHLVGDDDHRHAVFGEADHHVEHLVDHLGVERAGRLVEEHQLRLHRERPGDRDALLLAAGELRRHLRRLVGDADAVEQLHRRASRRPCVTAAHLDRPEGDVLEDRLVREEVERLEDHADVGTQLRERRALFGQRLAVDRDRAGVDGLEAVDRAAERRLARARLGPMTTTTSPRLTTSW